MTDALTHFPPNRTAALERLHDFLPSAGKTYAARRNYDFGAGRHSGVSTLSPYIRTRLLTEEEVLQAVLGRFSLSSAEKFVQEVYWRTYWKGWLEMRPSVWAGYRAGLSAAWDRVQSEGGLRRDWESACLGQTGIECFDHWAKELAATGYLHNHARMWFASIWIFTLRLPWELGADFFLRHLLDGDPASNTLSWRWVGGLQTVGKTYLARPDNIAKYTEGRFRPEGLAEFAPPLDGTPAPARAPLPMAGVPDRAARTGFLLHPEDVSPRFALDQCPAPVVSAPLICAEALSPLAVSPHVAAFQRGAVEDCAARHGVALGPELSRAQEVLGWAKAQGLEQIVTAYAPVGPVADVLAQVTAQGMQVVQVRRSYDSDAWPFATHGFFRFKEKIPKLVAGLNQMRLVG